ncbi:Mini zinc finger protein 2 [Glycine max]|nr:Mini zinc finger protein 2 [Glycine max]
MDLLQTMVGREVEGEHTMRRVILRRDGRTRYSNNSLVTIVRHVRYIASARNLSYRIGGIVVDGYREFVVSGAEGTGGAMTCATCGCHRNFHRKEEQTQMVCACSSHPTTRSGEL